MSINKMLVITALTVVGVATAIAAVGLVHELTTAPDPHILMHSLEGWVNGVAYHLALIVLAATAVNYLASRR